MTFCEINIIVAPVSIIDTTGNEWMSLIAVTSKVNNPVDPSLTMMARGSSCALGTTFVTLYSDSDGAPKFASWDQFLDLANVENNKKYNCKKYCDQYPFHYSNNASQKSLTKLTKTRKSVFYYSSC